MLFFKVCSITIKSQNEKTSFLDNSSSQKYSKKVMVKKKGRGTLLSVSIIVIGLGIALYIWISEDSRWESLTDNPVVTFFTPSGKSDHDSLTALYNRNNKPFESDPLSSSIELIKLNIEKLRNDLHPIEFAGNDHSALFPFIKALREENEEKSQLRIFHYGDSQIEGDRITSYLRSRLQKEFGGSGIGFVPVGPSTGYISYSLRTSDNSDWVTMYAGGRKGYGDSRFNFSESFLRFKLNKVENGDSVFDGFIEIRIQPAARNFHLVRLLSGNNKAAVQLKVFADEQEIESTTLEPVSGYRTSMWSFKSSPSHVRFIFEGKDSPDIAGLLLDNSSGVIIDNIPQRGSSGVELVRLNPSVFSGEVKQLGVKLILLQYGVNAVPYAEQSEEQVESWFYQSLMKLRNMAPETSIIVLGVSDVSKKEGTSFITHPNVEIIRSAQRKAAFRAGCAFWDVFSAMGGKNAMAAWVEHEPPLGEKDFIHFTPAGAGIIAEMFYRALMYEVYNYSFQSLSGNGSATTQ